MNPVSKYNALKHYVWGSGCDGWNLAETAELSIKQERMPAKASEEKHYHEKAQQFFFILKGEALFEVNDEICTVKEGEGLYIKAGDRHRIINNTEEDLEFILCSQPSTANDRINVF
ncbi:MAG TPA: cupin domain-containing protein [Flavisolibacter sp.]|nr:cupin domain-containing protein [Flavisolibacter sp.]